MGKDSEVQLEMNCEVPALTSLFTTDQGNAFNVSIRKGEERRKKYSRKHFSFNLLTANCFVVVVLINI